MDIKPSEEPKQNFGERYANEIAGPSPTPDPAPASAPTSNSKPPKGESWRSVFGTVLLFLMAPALALAIAAYGIQSYQVDGQSMETTLQNNDRLIVDKVPRTWARLTGHAYIPKRGDIIIFNESGLFDANGLPEKQLIKRVIGVPGDHVVVANGKVTVYNAQHPNGFDPDTTGAYHTQTPTNLATYNDVHVKAGQVFVMGDNRPHSEDSRYFGPINANQIVGQLALRVIPLSKAERF